MNYALCFLSGGLTVAWFIEIVTLGRIVWVMLLSTGAIVTLGLVLVRLGVGL